METLKRKEEKSLSIQEQINILKNACKMYGMQFTQLHDSRELDKMRISRAFDDVLHYDNHLYIAVEQNILNNIEMKKYLTDTLITVWHELGHLVVSTAEERIGQHWVPGNISCLKQTSREYLDFCSANEELAVGASYYLMYLFGMPKESIKWVDNVTGGHEGIDELRCFSVDDLDYFEFKDSDESRENNNKIIKLCNNFYSSFIKENPGY